MAKIDLDSIAQGLFELGFAVEPVTEPKLRIAINTLTVAAEAMEASPNSERTAELLASMFVFSGYVVAYLAEQGIDAIQLVELYETALALHQSNRLPGR